MEFEFKVTVHYDLWTKCTQLWPLKITVKFKWITAYNENLSFTYDSFLLPTILYTNLYEYITYSFLEVASPELWEALKRKEGFLKDNLVWLWIKWCEGKGKIPHAPLVPPGGCLILTWYTCTCLLFRVLFRKISYSYLYVFIRDEGAHQIQKLGVF